MTSSVDILRLEGANGSGPFCLPYPFTVRDAKAHLPWMNLRIGSIDEHLDAWSRWLNGGRLFGLFEPELCPDDAHPHHLSDVFQRNFGPNVVMERGFSTSLLGKGHWRCGVKDQQQLLHWFPTQSHRFLASFGFGVAHYRVARTFVRAGRFQLVFDIDQALLVRRYSLMDFEELAEAA